MQIIIFLFLCMVWGTTWAAIKISLGGLPPFLGSGLRFTIASFLLLGFMLLKGVSFRLNKKHLKYIFFSAFLMYVMDYGLIYWGEQFLSAGVTSIFFATFPIFTGIWATFLFRSEKFQWNKFAGLLLGFMGILLVFYDQLLQTRFSQSVIYGTAAIILGAAGGGMAVVIVKKYLSEVNHVSLSFYQMIHGVFFLLIFGFLFENAGSVHLTARVWLAVIYLGGVGSALAFALYYWLLQKVSAITVSLIIYITPLVALLVDFLLFGEVVHPRAVVGMMIIFSGVALTEFDRRRFFVLQQRFFIPRAKSGKQTLDQTNSGSR